MARASTAAGPYRPSGTVYVSANVEIDPEDLHDQGWHREDECGDFLDGEAVDDLVSRRHQTLQTIEQELVTALDDMHRQAHPHEPLRWRWCQQEPCRTLQIKVVSLS